MRELKLSIIILVSYIIIVLGISNIDQFQESYIDFSPVFFVLIAIVVFFQLIVTSFLSKTGVKISYYAIIAFWFLVYLFLWGFYFQKDRSLEVNLIQLLLFLLSAVLAYDVGRRMDQFDRTLEGLSSSAYPNRVRDIRTSHDLISAELTRSRRYHHPLSILSIRLDTPKGKDGWKELETIANDMVERFAIAKVSQILSELARNTDLVLNDKDGQFVVVCPETNLNNITILADRIKSAVEESMNAKIEWGGATFPDEAITFDDLLQTAQKRLSSS